jgi:hypothetical protein
VPPRCSKLYFGNLPNDTPEDSLRSLAASAGKIESIELGRQNRCVPHPSAPALLRCARACRMQLRALTVMFAAVAARRACCRIG